MFIPQINNEVDIGQQHNFQKFRGGGGTEILFLALQCKTGTSTRASASRFVRLVLLCLCLSISDFGLRIATHRFSLSPDSARLAPRSN
ncbi:AAI domain-containing protein [Psidium guajava]|nr:AAI domain-containing protein [Psidium guajava]